MPALLTSFLLLFFSWPTSAATPLVLKPEKKHAVRLQAPVLFPLLSQLQEWDADIWSVHHATREVDAYLSGFQKEALENQGLVMRPLGQVELGEGERPAALMARRDERYLNFSEVQSALFSIHEGYPSLTKLVDFGRSVEGRTLWAIKISDNPESDEAEEPAILFNSMHHAREVMTPEVALDIVRQLTGQYESDPQIQKWVNGQEIWVVPMLNPDGNHRVWHEDIWWRKNTGHSHGVDLNRNYPYQWGACNGSSGRERSQTYRGPGPASEPETQALMSLVARIKPVLNLSYHSYGQLVIYPYGCDGERTETQSVVEGIGDQLGDALGHRAGTAWELLYAVDGSDIDWMYNDHQVIPYVIELSGRDEGFHPPYIPYRDQTVERNRAGWQFILARAEGPGLRGQLVGAAASQATIEATNANTGRQVPSYRVNPDGSFHLVLNPGRYQLEAMIHGQSVFSGRYQIGDSRVDIDPVVLP